MCWILALLLLASPVVAQEEAAKVTLPVGAIRSYSMFDSTAIVKTAADTSGKVVIAGADLMGYWTRYKSTTTAAILSYIDVSPNGYTWFPLSATATDSLFYAGVVDQRTRVTLSAIPDNAVYARARIVGRVAANQTVTSWMWWTLVWVGAERMR